VSAVEDLHERLETASQALQEAVELCERIGTREAARIRDVLPGGDSEVDPAHALRLVRELHR
jgi:hypothetical protein